MDFTATLELNGRTATGFAVPPEVVTGLAGGGRPKVTVTVNGHTYRSSIAPMGGRHMVGVSAENRAAAGVEAGDTVEVSVELDTAPRVVEVPADLAAALDAEPAARAFFDGLSYSKQQYFVLPVEGAKTSETRQRRIDAAVAKLAAGSSR